MREGINPVRNKTTLIKVDLHRVIIPLYIPNEEGYYKEAFRIFEYCLSSIRITSSSNLKISIISNGCCESVNKSLFQMYENKEVDELIIERESIGKVNSVLKVLRTAEERFVTISDADVLFCNGWEKAIYAVFEAFPKAGAVCPTPVFRKHNNLTANIWFDYFFSKRLKFSPVVNKEAMTRFANSIGWSRLDEKYKDVMLTLEAKNGLKAMVGCSHFVATYKREVFKEMPKFNSKFLLGGNSIHDYFDFPVLKRDGYRLSTEQNYAFHMGNTIEDWIVSEFKGLEKHSKKEHFLINSAVLKKNFIKFFLSEKVLKKISSYDFIMKSSLKRKGLSEEQIKNFTS